MCQRTRLRTPQRRVVDPPRHTVDKHPDDVDAKSPEPLGEHVTTIGNGLGAKAPIGTRKVVIEGDKAGEEEESVPETKGTGSRDGGSSSSAPSSSWYRGSYHWRFRTRGEGGIRSLRMSSSTDSSLIEAQ
ncbi:hypothetical protein PQX77_010341 [Marasmius sp. AFHP31]|nr:hypothetical protein PQX77_010341 [Marasmius sp. AFHP31]